jgi:hypothetical protein
LLPIPVLLDLVEAAVGCGHADRLVDIIAELGAVAERSKSPLLHAEWLAAQPLLSPKMTRRDFSLSAASWRTSSTTCRPS